MYCWKRLVSREVKVRQVRSEHKAIKIVTTLALCTLLTSISLFKSIKKVI